MQCALKIICVFSVIIHQNIDPKSTENPATWREARMHDFGISICCAENHHQKKHPPRGCFEFCADTTVWWPGIRLYSIRVASRYGRVVNNPKIYLSQLYKACSTKILVKIELKNARMRKIYRKSTDSN